MKKHSTAATNAAELLCQVAKQMDFISFARLARACSWSAMNLASERNTRILSGQHSHPTLGIAPSPKTQQRSTGEDLVDWEEVHSAFVRFYEEETKQILNAKSEPGVHVRTPPPVQK